MEGAVQDLQSFFLDDDNGSFSPMMANAQENNDCCESPDEFDLFLIGDPDSGQLTPFSNELEEEKSMEVTSSVLERLKSVPG